jgi:small GTP-binding protein
MERGFFMSRKNPAKNINIGLLAHVDAGKTTLSEALLYATGQIRALGRVDHQDAFLDTDAQERARGITIFSKQARLRLQMTDENLHSEQTIGLTILDTPGHVDFSAEMERTLQVLDYAILVISGTDGVQGHTRTLWRLLQHYNIPTFLFVNKMDLPGADKEVVQQKPNCPMDVWILHRTAEKHFLRKLRWEAKHFWMSIWIRAALQRSIWRMRWQSANCFRATMARHSK